MDEQFNKATKGAKKLGEETAFIKDMIVGIGEQIKFAIEEAVDGLNQTDTVTQRIAKSYERDILRNLIQINKINDKNYLLIEKTKKGICYRAMIQLNNKKGKEKRITGKMLVD